MPASARVTLDRLLAKAPHSRYPSFRDLRRDLDGTLEELGTKVRGIITERHQRQDAVGEIRICYGQAQRFCSAKPTAVQDAEHLRKNEVAQRRKQGYASMI